MMKLPIKAKPNRATAKTNNSANKPLRLDRRNLPFRQDMVRCGLSPTRSRLAIMQVIGESHDHPDAERILERAMLLDKSVSLATVYRNLKIFSEAGLIQKLEFGDGRARYEIDPPSHHDHLIDIDSGDVIEFHDEALEQLQDIIAKRLGFSLVGHRMELYGRRLPAKADDKAK